MFQMTSTDHSLSVISTEISYAEETTIDYISISTFMSATGTDSYVYTTIQPLDSTSSLSYQITSLTSLTGEISSDYLTEEIKLTSSKMSVVIELETSTKLKDDIKSSTLISSSMEENELFSSIIFSPSSKTPSESLLHTTFSISTSLIDSISDSSVISFTPSIQLISTSSETTTAYRDITSIFPSTPQTLTEVITMCSCNSEESHYRWNSKIIPSTSDQPCYTSTIHQTTCSSYIKSTSVFETTSVDCNPCSCPIQQGKIKIIVWK